MKKLLIALLVTCLISCNTSKYVIVQVQKSNGVYYSSGYNIQHKFLLIGTNKPYKVGDVVKSKISK